MEKRTGKTAKDRAVGAMRQNELNKEARASWERERTTKGNRAHEPFPSATCNGKKNRYVK